MLKLYFTAPLSQLLKDSHDPRRLLIVAAAKKAESQHKGDFQRFKIEFWIPLGRHLDAAETVQRGRHSLGSWSLLTMWRDARSSVLTRLSVVSETNSLLSSLFSCTPFGMHKSSLSTSSFPVVRSYLNTRPSQTPAKFIQLLFQVVPWTCDRTWVRKPGLFSAQGSTYWRSPMQPLCVKPTTVPEPRFSEFASEFLGWKQWSPNPPAIVIVKNVIANKTFCWKFENDVNSNTHCVSMIAY